VRHRGIRRGPICRSNSERPSQSTRLTPPQRDWQIEHPRTLVDGRWTPTRRRTMPIPLKRGPFAGKNDGEGQNRTGDTTIFVDRGATAGHGRRRPAKISLQIASIATIATCGPVRVTPRLCGLVDAWWTSRGPARQVSADAHEAGGESPHHGEGTLSAAPPGRPRHLGSSLRSVS
jgi:hypothetical protein